MFINVICCTNKNIIKFWWHILRKTLNEILQNYEGVYNTVMKIDKIMDVG